jgi:hypothetical protein
MICNCVSSFCAINVKKKSSQIAGTVVAAPDGAKVPELSVKFAVSE